MGKTLQSPSLVLAKPRKDMNKVSFRCDMTEILLKAAQNTIQSINHCRLTLYTAADIHGESVIPSSTHLPLVVHVIPKFKFQS